MLIDLSGRTALVTGSTAGIGRAIGVGLAQAGANVVINGRAQAHADEVAEAVSRDTSSAGRIRGVGADIGSAEGCAALIEAVPDVDILVNNAGVFEAQPVFEIPDEAWMRHFEVNVMSGGSPRSTLCPSDGATRLGTRPVRLQRIRYSDPHGDVHYGMPKTALLAVSRGTAESVPATGITINCLLRSCQGSLDDDDLATLEDVKQAKNPMQAIAEQS